MLVFSVIPLLACVSSDQPMSLGNLLNCTRAAPAAKTAMSTTVIIERYVVEAFCWDQDVCVAPVKRVLMGVGPK